MIPPPDDPVFRQLGRLAPAVPDPAHSARVRARCHAGLARRRRQHEASARPPAANGAPLAVALVGSLSLIYLAVVIGHALAIYGAS
jgi:hypothetical protein